MFVKKDIIRVIVLVSLILLNILLILSIILIINYNQKNKNIKNERLLEAKKKLEYYNILINYYKDDMQIKLNVLLIDSKKNKLDIEFILKEMNSIDKDSQSINEALKQNDLNIMLIKIKDINVKYDSILKKYLSSP